MSVPTEPPEYEYGSADEVLDEDPTISASVMHLWLYRHGVDIGDKETWDDFVEHCGPGPLYSGADVLKWLGY